MYFLIIAVFGLIWGLLEATLGGLLHSLAVPFTGAIMSAIGFTILYVALRAGVKLGHLFVISTIAASGKFLDCFLFNLPVSHILIINPVTAIASMGLAMTLVFRNSIKKDGWLALASRFFVAGAISIAVFNLTSIIVYGWPTAHTIMPLKTAFVHLPYLTALTTVLAKGISKTRVLHDLHLVR